MIRDGHYNIDAALCDGNFDLNDWLWSILDEAAYHDTVNRMMAVVII